MARERTWINIPSLQVAGVGAMRLDAVLEVLNGLQLVFFCGRGVKSVHEPIFNLISFFSNNCFFYS